METKRCTKCGKELVVSLDFFPPRKGTKDGLHQQCRECLSVHKKAYADAHKEHKRLKDAEYVKQHKEKITAWKKQNYEKNKEAISIKQKEYAKENAEKIKQRRKEYYEKNREVVKEKVSRYHEDNKDKSAAYKIDNRDKIAEYGKKYYLLNKNYFKEHNRKYGVTHKEERNIYKLVRESKKREIEHSFSQKDWDAAKTHFKHRCAYCGENRQLTQEHLIPLSKGGGMTRKNIIPACSSCNSSKKDREFLNWYKTQAFYSREREKAIIEYTQAQ